MRKNAIILFSLILFLAIHGGEKVVVTAHRGASGLAPENTMAAVLKAVEIGADFSEIDVQETRDGVVILLHDTNLARTTGVNRNIWEAPYDSLNGLDAGSWFKPEFKGEPIPTLSSVMDSVNGKMKLNIELKMNGHQQQLAERVVKLIEEKAFRSNCILTSFDFEIIDKVRQLNKNIRVGYIFRELPQDKDVFSANVDILSANWELVDKNFVKTAQAHNKEVHVWTVNEAAEMKRLIDLGVNSIITDRPDILVGLLQ